MPPVEPVLATVANVLESIPHILAPVPDVFQSVTPVLESVAQPAVVECIAVVRAAASAKVFSKFMERMGIYLQLVQVARLVVRQGLRGETPDRGTR
jgi:hypothetical protein